MPQDEKAAIAGFFGEFDFNALAKKAESLKLQSEPRSTDLSDVVAEKASLRQDVGTSESLPYNPSDSLTDYTAEPGPQRRSVDLIVRTTEGQYVTTSGPMTQNASDGQNVTTSVRQVTNVINTGVTRGQLPILKWLIQVCGNQEVIVTYKMASTQLQVTERAVRTHIESLNKKGLIAAHTAHRPGSLQPIGKAIRVRQNAHLALALSQPSDENAVMTQKASLRQNVTTAEQVPHIPSGSQTVRTPDRQTYSSSSYEKTTTAFLENSEDEGYSVFDKLYLDDWEQWGLRPKMISDHLGKDIVLLQNILDKTAYVIKKKEGTPFAIHRKIGFLNKCLENEICEVDSDFVCRKEKLLAIKNKQIKEEVERIKKAHQELEQSTLELLRLNLSEEELNEVRKKAINIIKNELKSDLINVPDAQIASYENRILLSIAKERGII